MKIKGRKQSKNIEKAKPVDEGIKWALDNFGEDATNAAYHRPKKEYMGTAKKQLRDRQALATGKKLMGKDIAKSMEGAARRDKAAKPKGPRIRKPTPY